MLCEADELTDYLPVSGSDSTECGGAHIKPVALWQSASGFVRNIVHGSDSVESANKEISLWFKPEELMTYTSCAFSWLYWAALQMSSLHSDTTHVSSSYCTVVWSTFIPVQTFHTVLQSPQLVTRPHPFC